MSDHITRLEDKLRHAREVAAISIGQPDRAENVAYREQVATELLMADPQRHPFKTNGFPVETCMTCGHRESAHQDNRQP